jgi:hypothetical protein
MLAYIRECSLKTMNIINNQQYLVSLSTLILYRYGKQVSWRW